MDGSLRFENERTSRQLTVRTDLEVRTVLSMCRQMKDVFEYRASKHSLFVAMCRHHSAELQSRHDCTGVAVAWRVVWVAGRWVCEKLTLTIALAVAMTAQSVSAQSAEPSRETYWLRGASAAVPSVSGETYFLATMFGYHATVMRESRPGLDLSLAIAPVALAYGAVAGAVTTGVVFPLEMSPSLLVLPTAGVTLAGAVGGGGADRASGLHAGAYFSTARRGKQGLRVGLTAHLLGGAGSTVWLLAIGLADGR